MVLLIRQYPGSCRSTDPSPSLRQEPRRQTRTDARSAALYPSLFCGSAGGGVRSNGGEKLPLDFAPQSAKIAAKRFPSSAGLCEADANKARRCASDSWCHEAARPETAISRSCLRWSSIILDGGVARSNTFCKTSVTRPGLCPRSRALRRSRC